MTLEEKAKKIVRERASGTPYAIDYYANLLVEFANETTKELQEDLKHKRIAIQNRKVRIKDLEKQIEKMKNCWNCKHDCKLIIAHFGGCDFLGKKEKWEWENDI